MSATASRKSDTQTPAIPAVPMPPSVFAELLHKWATAVVRIAPSLRDRIDQALPEMLDRYSKSECGPEVCAALEATLNGMLNRLSAPTGSLAEFVDAYAALRNTFGELFADHRAPGQGRLGVKLGGKDEPDTVEALTLAQGGERARELSGELDAAEATFAERLAVCLKRAGVSQSELAEKLGVRPSAVSMMLRRPSRPQPRTVARIAAALNVSPTDLWPPARPSEPVTDMCYLRASELARLPRAVWEPVLTAAAERAAAEYRTDPELGGLDAFVFEAQYIDWEKVPFRASELLRWPPHLRDYYLAAAAEQAAEEYRTNPELSGLEAYRYESQFLD